MSRTDQPNGASWGMSRSRSVRQAAWARGLGALLVLGAAMPQHREAHAGDPDDQMIDDGAIVLDGLVRTQPPSVLRRNVVGVAALGYRAGVIRSDGSIALWGPTYLPGESANIVGWPPESAPPSPIVQVANNTDPYWLALCADGSVLAGGITRSGQPVFPAPTTPPGIVFTQVAGTPYRTIALRSDGQIVAWPYTPTFPPAPEGLIYTQIAGYGLSTILALRSDGQIIASHPSSQGLIPALPSGMTYTTIKGGSQYALALRSDGRIVAWGSSDAVLVTAPEAPAGRSVTAIAGGGFHGVALLDDGTLMHWGHSSVIGTPPTLPNGVHYVAVEAGQKQTIALRSDGRAVCFGTSELGRTNGVELPDGVKFDALAIADEVFNDSPTIVAAADDGTVHVWGYIRYPGLVTVPTLPEGVRAIDSAIGNQAACLLLDDGSILCWGSNSNGQLNVPPLSEGLRYEQISAEVSSSRFAAIRSDGAVVCWGGAGACPDEPLPDGRRYTRLSAGKSWTILALRDDGVVKCWFSSGAECSAPTLGDGLRYVDVDAGCSKSGGAALVSDGTIRCWGGVAQSICSNWPPPTPGETYDSFVMRWAFGLRFGQLGTTDHWGNGWGELIMNQPKAPPGFELSKRVIGQGTVGAILRALPIDACPSDLSGDRVVDGADLGWLLGLWGTNSTLADLNGDGVVDGHDLGALLGSWGPCPPRNGE